MRLRDAMRARVMRVSRAKMQMLLAVCVMALSAAAYAETAPVTVTQDHDDVLVRTGTDTLRLRACEPGVLHIVASPDAAALEHASAQPWLVKPCTATKLTLTMPAPRSAEAGQANDDFKNVATIDTGKVRIRVSLVTGSLQFSDRQDTVLLQEFWLAPRHYQPVTANGESLYAASELFHPLGSDEAVYGLGQHQNGVFNYRGTVIPLAQANTDVNIPMLVSTKGYGLFWNTASRAEFDNRFATEMRLSAAATRAIDYYFIYGPEMDQIIHTYRTMTGQSPLFAKWAYGFVQSKNSYNSQDEVLKVAANYRERHLPLDLIVQDATWSDHLGDPTFRRSAYSDVPSMLKQLHTSHVHAMVSVWGVLDTATENYRQMKERGFLIPGTTDYDPTNPAAADFYWKNHAGKLFEQGWDAFWLDASEPERGMNDGRSDGVLENTRLAIGNGALYANIYPLMHAANMYEHWRATTENKRVMLLSRSGFAGMQREGAFIWSGDIYSTYLSLQRQLPAGLNYALAGMPYWTTDIGGYGWPNPPKDTRTPEYQKLYARWFEFGAFCPIFRAHGLRSNNENEIFSYPDIESILTTYDRLRYRLLPYIYSVAWKVTSEDGTLMRPLVMDWRTDEKVWNIGDQFMFGPALLVSPVTKEDEYQRSLYLPHAAAWYDFWTGEKLQANKRIEVESPLDRIPLHVPAGTILPLGPEIEYADEKPDGAIELRIYPGADGSFDLYEDAGDGYGYEKGEHSVISIHWDESTQSVTIGDRVGKYPGMIRNRVFHVVLVGPGHGAGPKPSAKADQVIAYSGEALRVSVQAASSSTGQ